MPEKPCRICGAVRPLEDFHRATGMRDGHRNECRDCSQALSRARYAQNRERYIAGVRRWQRENPDRMSEYRRQRNARPEVKRRARDAYFMRTYGVTADEVDEMLDAQNGRCAICGVQPERLASMHVDHDHERGHLRGLLCVSCNQGLGQFRDDPAILLRAIVYLRQRRSA
jgi:hypothetical protein